MIKVKVINTILKVLFKIAEFFEGGVFSWKRCYWPYPVRCYHGLPLLVCSIIDRLVLYSRGNANALCGKKERYLQKDGKVLGKFFLINFAVGVVTGIIQEFQFGMNWSDYSRLLVTSLVCRLQSKHFWHFLWNPYLLGCGFSDGTGSPRKSIC